MPSARIAKAVDVLEDGHLGFSSRLPRPAPDQLRLDRLEECLDVRAVVTIALTAHRHLETIVVQKFLVVVRTVLASLTEVMDAALARLPLCNNHLLCTHCQLALHLVAHRPANATLGMQIEDDRLIEPAFPCPDISDIACPLLVRLICTEVALQ